MNYILFVNHLPILSHIVNQMKNLALNQLKTDKLGVCVWDSLASSAVRGGGGHMQQSRCPRSEFPTPAARAT